VKKSYKQDYYSPEEKKLYFMNLAIKESLKSLSHNPRDPKVGIVVVKNGMVIDKTHPSKTNRKKNYTFADESKKLTIDFRGAEIFTTLEPCVLQSNETLLSTEWILAHHISKVFIGMLHPNQNFCGKGYWSLLERQIPVEFFPPSLVETILKENEPFLHRFRGKLKFDSSFERFIKNHKASSIQSYMGLGWNHALSLQDCPNLQEGWPVTQVELHHDDSKTFSFPQKYRSAFQAYYKRYYNEKRLYDDGRKIMVTHNPIAFSDSPTLKLHTINTCYSENQFYHDAIATVPKIRDTLIKELLQGSLKVNFPHSLCMQMIVITNDNKILLTKRSPKVFYYPHTWSVSIEENLSREDLRNHPKRIITRWCKRLLSEELGMRETAYYKDRIRVISTFIEADTLNISLCSSVELTLDSQELDTLLSSGSRADYEFTEWFYLDYQQKVLLSELQHPTRNYQPTSGYRLLMALLKQFGIPTNVETSIK
jgi:pyrimidine deaminase RibD-like protein